MKTITLWAWYIALVIVVWILFILPKLGGLPILTGLLCALLFALIMGIILLPYYQRPPVSDRDQLSLDIFVVTATILPILVLFLVLITGESKKYWKHGIRPDLVESMIND